MTADLNSLITKVGGQKNATILAGTAGAGVIWYLGRRKASKASQNAPVNVMAQGYADTAQDPTALYTGYDQLQQEIDSLRTQPGAPNPNPVPTPSSPGSPPPVAPIPAAPAPTPTPIAPAPLSFEQTQPAGLPTAYRPVSDPGTVMGGSSITGYGWSQYGPGPAAAAEPPSGSGGHGGRRPPMGF